MGCLAALTMFAFVAILSVTLTLGAAALGTIIGLWALIPLAAAIVILGWFVLNPVADIIDDWLDP